MTPTQLYPQSWRDIEPVTPVVADETARFRYVEGGPYASGQLDERMDPEGIWRFWFDGGQLAAEIQFDFEWERRGECRRWHPAGALVEHGTYNGSEPTGWQFWYPSGERRATVRRINRQRTRWEYWHANGREAGFVELGELDETLELPREKMMAAGQRVAAEAWFDEQGAGVRRVAFLAAFGEEVLGVDADAVRDGTTSPSGSWRVGLHALMGVHGEIEIALVEWFWEYRHGDPWLAPLEGRR